jgi:hypothetical protein
MSYERTDHFSAPQTKLDAVLKVSLRSSTCETSY